MVHFVGAGSGAPDLITVRGQRLISEADVIIYAGSLVNPALLENKKDGCRVFDSAKMTLEEVIEVMRDAEKKGLMTVRLHTGDPCVYGAVREQMDLLEAEGIPYDSTPGVSSFCGAAAALDMEYTLPGISQSVIITRMAGRTPVPDRESIESFGRIRAGYAGRHRLQGDLAGGREVCLHGGNAGGDSSSSRHHEDGADHCRRRSRPERVRALEAL